MAKPLTDFFTVGINGTTALTRTFIQTTTGQYSVFQNTSGGTFVNAIIYSATNTNAGYTASGSGDFYFIYFRIAQ
jgi:hypothetical protein